MNSSPSLTWGDEVSAVSAAGDAGSVRPGAGPSRPSSVTGPDNVAVAVPRPAQEALRRGRRAQWGTPGRTDE
ncbi:hypothetical protein GCM10009680_67020 [Streptomyces yatensis]|uniref:Uncharacterized protein n=1 Tax=Streptomyces yatensis TaxID=155177 RepID=A0ABN2J1V3_9ACTN